MRDMMSTTQHPRHFPTAPGRTFGRVALATLWIAPTLLVMGTVAMLTPNAWTVAHAVYLTGAVGMILVGVTLTRWTPGTGPSIVFARAGGVLTLLGALALTAQFVIDFWVMSQAGGERAVAAELVGDLQQVPLITLTVYAVGPALLFVGLMLSGVAMVRTINGPGWVLLGGSALMGLARVVDQRVLEVPALIVVVIALGWLARRLADSVPARTE